MNKICLILLVFTCGPGCTIYNLDLPGKLSSKPMPLGGEDGQTPWGQLAFDDLGNLTLNGKPLRVSYAQETRRFGVSFLDASALPRLFRPQYSPTSGGGLVMVAAVERASPLAIAGLRPFDMVRSLNGATLKSASDLAESLARIEPGKTARLEFISPRGPASIEAVATEDIRSSRNLDIFIADVESSRTASHFGLGPFTLLFYRFSGLLDSENLPEEPGKPWPRYTRLTYWRFFTDFFEHWTWVDPSTGREKSRWRLFWFIGPDGEWKAASS